LRRRYYEETGGAAGAEAVRRAQFDSPERTVHFRVAEHDGHIYLDHADKHWRAVEIGTDGWRIIAFPPVRFRRAAGMLALPLPEREGLEACQTLFASVPIPDDGSWRNAGWPKNPRARASRLRPAHGHWGNPSPPSGWIETSTSKLSCLVHMKKPRRSGAEVGLRNRSSLSELSHDARPADRLPPSSAKGPHATSRLHVRNSL
jgi:hypothetical protein